MFDVAYLAFCLRTVIIFMHLVIKLKAKGRFVFLYFKKSLSKFNMLMQKTNWKAFVKKKIFGRLFLISRPQVYHFIFINVLLSNDEMLYLVLTRMQLCIKLESSNLPYSIWVKKKDVNTFFNSIATFWLKLISANN